MPVVDTYCSCSAEFVRCPSRMSFCDWMILLDDEELLDTLSLALSDSLLSWSFPPVRCACWLFLSSLASLLPKSLSVSCCCDEGSGSIANLVLNFVFDKVLNALLLPLPLFCGVCR